MRLLSRFAFSLSVSGLALVACGGSRSHALDPRTKDPCVSYTPDSFAAGWSLPEDRRCTTSADCVIASVKFDVDCPWGTYGGFVSAVSSRAAEARVKARLGAVDRCGLREHQQVGSVCASPPLECSGGLCGFADGPPRIAY